MCGEAMGRTTRGREVEGSDEGGRSGVEVLGVERRKDGMGQRGRGDSLRVVVVVAAVAGIFGCGSQQFIHTEDGVRLAYEVYGSGPDTVIVPLASYLAADWGEELAPDRTIIFYDPRARGASTLPTDTTRLGLEYDVADLEVVRSHFDVHRPALIGWWYYAVVVAEYAARNPENAGRVVLVSPMPIRATAPYWEQLNERAGRADSTFLRRFRKLKLEGWEERDPEVFCRAKLRFADAPPMMNDPTALMIMRANPCRYSNEWPGQLDVRMGRIMDDLGDWDFREVAAAVRSPVLVLHGLADHIPWEASREWAEHMDNALLLLFPRAGRFVWLEAITSFFSGMDVFLQGEVPWGATVVRDRR